MKFACERCNTRYSIANDRVRGKILKIRCKRCQNIISVSEEKSVDAGVPAPPPLVAGQPTPPPTPPPVPVPADEWYVSVDGSQKGPFDLKGAQQWVTERPLSDEIYCWKEGFQEWLLVGEVSEFSGLRELESDSEQTIVGGGIRPARAQTPFPPVPTPAPPAPTPASSAPMPLAAVAPQHDAPADVFAADAQKTEESEAPAVGAPGVASEASAANGSGQGANDLDLEFGEVSRIVRLPFLNLPGAGGDDSDHGLENDLPGVGRVGFGTGPARAIRPPVSLPNFLVEGAVDSAPYAFQSTRGKRALVPLVIGGSLLFAVIGVFVFLATRPTAGEGQRLRKSRLATGGLGFTQSDDRGGAKRVETGTTPERPTTTRASRRNGRATATKKPSAMRRKTSPPRKSTEPEEVSLGEVGLGMDAPRELSPDDVSIKYRKSSAMITRCYERALKKDAFLSIKVGAADVSISTSGKTSVKVIGITNNTLRTCIESNMRRWKFPATESGLGRTRVKLVFK